MPRHKFKVGQSVRFTPGKLTPPAGGQAYTIVRAIPAYGSGVPVGGVCNDFARHDGLGLYRLERRACAKGALLFVVVFGRVNDACHVWRILINLLDQGVVFLRGRRVLFVFECDLLRVVFGRYFLLRFVGCKRWWLLVRSSEASHRYFRCRLSGNHIGGLADWADDGLAV